MVTPKELLDIIERFAPFGEAKGWDNSGLLVDCKNAAEKILFCLDVTEDTLSEANRLGCGIVVSHHPVIFGGIKNISLGDPVMTAVRLGISVISAHTNCDIADGGINDALCDLLEIAVYEKSSNDAARYGRVSRAMSPETFGLYVAEKLNTNRLSIVFGERDIKKVAVAAGGGFDDMQQVYNFGIDAVVAGELRHSEAIDAKRYSLTAVAAGHFATEFPGMAVLARRVGDALKTGVECIISSDDRDPLRAVRVL